MTPTKRRAEKTNDQAEDEDEKNQIAITACHAADETLMKQQRLNTAEAKDENFIADNTADERVDFATTSGEAVKEINVASTANNATNEEGVDVATTLNAVNEKKQTSLTNLL